MRHKDKTDRGCRACLRDLWQIVRNDRCNARVSPRCLTFGKQDKGLAHPRHLDVPGDHVFGQDGQLRASGKRGAVEVHLYALPVAPGRRSEIRGLETRQSLGGEQGGLNAGQHPNHPTRKAICHGDLHPGAARAIRRPKRQFVARPQQRPDARGQMCSTAAQKHRRVDAARDMQIPVHASRHRPDA